MVIPRSKQVASGGCPLVEMFGLVHPASDYSRVAEGNAGGDRGATEGGSCYPRCPGPLVSTLGATT